MSTEEFTTGDYVPKIAEELTDSGLQITGSVSWSTCGEQPISEGSLVTPVTPESGCFLPHEFDKERQYLADQEKNKQVVTGISGVPLLRSPKSNKPEDNFLLSPGNTASLPTSENPASLQDKDVQGYLETQASQETVVVGPNQTVLRTTETDGNVDKHLFLPLISLPQGHPSIGNRSVEEVVREYRRLNKQELNVTRTTGDNHSRVCPLAGQSEYVGTTGSSGSYDKPLSCSHVQEATTSIQCQTQLETELQQMKEDHQKLLEKYTQMKETLARLDKLEVQRKVEQQTWGDQRNQEVKRTFSEFWQHPHNYVSGTHHDDAYVRHKASDEMIWSSSDSSLEWRTVGNIYTQHGIYIENLDIRPHSFPFYGEVIDPIPSQVKFHRASSRGISLPLSEYYEKQLQDCEEFLSSVEERGKQDTALEELIAHVKKKISSLRTELEKSITKLQVQCDVLLLCIIWDGLVTNG
jgi:hypothetical protein